MQKLSVKYGCIFGCARPPPPTANEAALRGTRLLGAWYVGVVRTAITAFAGATELPCNLDPCAAWTWIGVSSIVSAWAASPPG
jgi:hypothetical protein